MDEQTHTPIQAAQPAAEPAPLSEPSEELSPQTIAQIKSSIYQMKDQLDGLLRLLSGQSSTMPHTPDVSPAALVRHSGERIVEGVFSGQHMIGSDGKEYPVPPNYASKSKLVEGDLLKLTVANSGAFIFKQIQPIERKRIVGELVHDPVSGQWSVLVDGKSYKILTASATFYKGRPGDDVTILVPEDGQSEWGAVENILHTS